MMSSRSIASSSSVRRALVWLSAGAVALAIVLAPAIAEARRRLVVLEFTGPKAEEFQEDVEKALKKGNSIVPRKKWDAAADKLKAAKINEKNVKKVAAKLQVDGVITGRVEKRGSRYYLHLQLREGKTGKTVAAPDIVERSAGLGADGRETIANELMPIIDDLEPPGDDEEEEDEEAEEDEEDEEPIARGKSGFGGRDRDKGKGKGKSRVEEDEEEEDEEAEEEDEEPVARGKGKGKGKTKPKPRVEEDEEADDEEEEASDDEEDGEERVADAGDDEGGGDDEDDIEIDDDTPMPTGDLTDPRQRAMDVMAGISFTGRKLSFTTNLEMNAPQGYDGLPVPGFIIAADVYPLAFNRKNKGFKRNIGFSLVFDRVLKITSNLKKMNMEYDLPTTEQHYAAGVIYRHPIGKQMQLEGSIRYNRRKFAIDKSNPDLQPGDVDIPSTSYTYVDPGLALKYIMSPTIVLGGDARFLLITDTGAMQNPNQYGGATVTGLDIEGGLDYTLGPKLLLRAALRVTTIGFAFKGNGELTNNRDGDATDTDVSGARDTYFGGFASGVYLF
jgi:hypothetical protein